MFLSEWSSSNKGVQVLHGSRPITRFLSYTILLSNVRQAGTGAGESREKWGMIARRWVVFVLLETFDSSLYFIIRLPFEDKTASMKEKSISRRGFSCLLSRLSESEVGYDFSFALLV